MIRRYFKIEMVSRVLVAIDAEKPEDFEIALDRVAEGDDNVLDDLLTQSAGVNTSEVHVRPSESVPLFKVCADGDLRRMAADTR